MELLDQEQSQLGFGGKGTSLTWLRRNGYRCPDFDLFDAGNWTTLMQDLRLDRVWATIRHGEDQFAFSLACHRLREAVLAAALPPAIEGWLTTGPIARLGGALAVRSSALSEDGSSASSAGQYESVLGVTTEAGLRRAIRDVLSSYYGERAVLYRRARGIDDSNQLAMGVVVQEMVNAEVCGIAFSRNPVTGNPGATIEASWGLGPPLVSGEIEPDRFEFEHGECRSISVGSKESELRFDPNSGVVRDASRPESGEPCISIEIAQEIAMTVDEMERRYGCAVDVEWAIPTDEDAEIVYLQIRPVTGAGPTAPAMLLSTY